MEQWTSPDCGTTRITNPKTLQRWIDLGWYQDLLTEGYVFNPYCGRFSIDICECSKCRHKTLNKDELIKILNNIL